MFTTVCKLETELEPKQLVTVIESLRAEYGGLEDYRHFPFPAFLLNRYVNHDVYVQVVKAADKCAVKFANFLDHSFNPVSTSIEEIIFSIACSPKAMDLLISEMITEYIDVWRLFQHIHRTPDPKVEAWFIIEDRRQSALIVDETSVTIGANEGANDENQKD